MCTVLKLYKESIKWPRKFWGCSGLGRFPLGMQHQIIRKQECLQPWAPEMGRDAGWQPERCPFLWAGSQSVRKSSFENKALCVPPWAKHLSFFLSTFECWGRRQMFESKQDDQHSSLIRRDHNNWLLSLGLVFIVPFKNWSKSRFSALRPFLFLLFLGLLSPPVLGEPCLGLWWLVLYFYLSALPLTLFIPAPPNPTPLVLLIALIQEELLPKYLRMSCPRHARETTGVPAFRGKEGLGRAGANRDRVGTLIS